MFSRYWRSYPFFLQLILFTLMVFTLMSFGAFIGLMLVPKLTGVPYKDIVDVGPASTMAASRAALWFNAITNFFIFAAPCLLFANLASPRPIEYLGLKRPRQPILLLAAAGLMIGYLLVSLPLEDLLARHLHLPKSMQDSNDALKRTNEAILRFSGPADLVRILFVLAVVVPFGEELMFRGVITRFVARRSRSIHLPVIISALLFAFAHSNPYGLVFILIAAFLLSAIFWRTGSLWCCMLGHAVYNGTQIVSQYLHRNDPPNTITTLPPYAIGLGAVLMAACGYWLYKSSSAMPLSWARDFNEDELKSAKEKWDIDAGNDASGR